MRWIRGIVKFTFFGGMILAFILHHETVKIFIRSKERRLRYYLASIKWHSRLALRLLNVEINLHKKPLAPGRKLIVANHLSYLDVMVFCAFYPSLFVTSREIHDTFLLGHICRLAGCFFVERRKARRTPGTVAKEIESMKASIQNGFDIFLFPEGTSTDGKSVLPFKTPFFQMAIDCGVPVRPVAIKYAESNREAVAWYGDMTFPDHLFRLCCQKKIEVTLTELAPIRPDIHSDRAELGLISHSRIHEVITAH